MYFLAPLPPRQHAWPGPLLQSQASSAAAALSEACQERDQAAERAREATEEGERVRGLLEAELSGRRQQGAELAATTAELVAARVKRKVRRGPQEALRCVN